MTFEDDFGGCIGLSRRTDILRYCHGTGVVDLENMTAVPCH
jgi:hypothetical protein